MSKPRLLDLFCGAGGAGMGYHRAGFEVVGVDIAPQPRYPFTFVQADALEYVAAHGRDFDAIHASPPCQGYSIATIANPSRLHLHKRTIPDVRRVLELAGRPWVIENVPGAIGDLQPTFMLCGLNFGLKMFRHRYFASSVMILSPAHLSHQGHRVGCNGFVCMAGHGDANHTQTPADHRTVAAWRAASGIDWMTRAEMAQAIPPAYTEFIGCQLINAVGM